MTALLLALLAQEPSPRVTPTVELVRRVLPSVVSIDTPHAEQKPGAPQTFTTGSGTVIHAAGYILTNDHVVRDPGPGKVKFHDDSSFPYRVVARAPREDLALLKINAGRELVPLPLGRSDDLQLGEPVVVIGATGGLANTVSTGIISGLNRQISTDRGAFLQGALQYSAPSSGGNSGGPVINAFGQIIGVVTSKRDDLQNVGFASAADQVGAAVMRMAAPELRGGFRLGFAFDAQAAVTAAGAELRVGDVVTSIDGAPVRHGVDLAISLLDRKPGQRIELGLQRGAVSVTLAEAALDEPVAADGAAPGLAYALYEGQWSSLPDFGALKPASSGRVERPSLALKAEGPFGLRYTGLLKVPAEGLYTFFTRSDDGSRLSVDGKRVVDNDGLHAERTIDGMVRLKAGLHPVVIDFFEAGGEKSLTVSWEGPGIPRQEIPAEAWFTTP